MKKNSSIKHIIFYISLILASFGFFFLYLGYLMLRTRPVPNPPGDFYQIRAAASEVFPDALYYDFEPPQPAEVDFYDGGRNSGTALYAPGFRGHSPVINIPAGNWDADKMSMISLEAWIKTDTQHAPANAELVIAITNALNDVIFSRTISIGGRFVKSNEWFRVSTSFQTSGYTYYSGDRIRVYIYNKSNNGVLMDDLTIIFGAHHPMGNDSLVSFYNRNVPFSKINTPPYPSFRLNKAEIGNLDAASLVSPTGAGNMLPGQDDILLAGNLLHPDNAAQEIIVIAPGKIEVYYYNQPEKKFDRWLLENNKITQRMLKDSRIFCGDPDGNHYDEILVVPETGDSIYIFSAPAQNKNDLKLQMKACALPEKSGLRLFSLLDVLGDDRPELLGIGPSGNWKIFSFVSGQWKAAAASKTVVSHWDESVYDYKLHNVTASAKGEKTQIFMTFSSKKLQQSGYQLLKYDNGKKEFISTFTGNSGFGLLQGSDTLSNEDAYFCFDVHPDDGPELLRRRNDWRYDLKLISLTDSTYQIRGNIDFNCLHGEINPKYYEKLTILPGCFMNKGEWGLLVFCKDNERKKKPSGYPEKVQIYLFKD